MTNLRLIERGVRIIEGYMFRINLGVYIIGRKCVEIKKFDQTNCCHDPGDDRV